jgi:hypothetical protein
MNPELSGRVLGLPHRVGADTEQVFNTSFWREADLVVTALVGASLF